MCVKNNQHGRLFTQIAFLLCLFFFLSKNFASTTNGMQIYKFAPPYADLDKTKVSASNTVSKKAENFWDVLRRGFALPHYEYYPLVQEKINWYFNNQDFLIRATMRAAPFLYYILQQVKERQIPTEIVLLPIIESGYNPFAISNAGAIGLWQMMPDTASGFGIKDDSWFDGRRDVIASTQGALDYLSYLKSFFEGNWLLAIAAYNTGEGNVLAAIKRNIREGRRTDFWSLPVAQQTRDYIPSLLALATIISHPHRYPIYLPPVMNTPYLARVNLGMPISLKYAATLADIKLSDLVFLNSGFNQLTATKKGPSQFIIPLSHIAKFTKNFSKSALYRSMKWIHYRVKPGDTLYALSRKFNSNVAQIKRLNHIHQPMLKTGTKLIIESRHKAPASHYRLHPGDTIYMVRKNDTLTKIAKRFHLRGDVIIAVNDMLDNHTLKQGQQIIIPTSHVK